jgi:hypothetical protein
VQENATRKAQPVGYVKGWESLLRVRGLCVMGRIVERIRMIDAFRFHYLFISTPVPPPLPPTASLETTIDCGVDTSAICRRYCSS